MRIHVPIGVISMKMQLEHLFLSVVLAFLGVLSGALAPTTAHAGTPSAANCSSGCNVTTCSSTWCTVDYCSDGNCRVIGGYRRVDEQLPGSNSIPDASPQAKPTIIGGNLLGGGDVEYVTFCKDGKHCSLVQLTNDGVKHIGSFEKPDLDDMIRNAESQRIGSGRE